MSIPNLVDSDVGNTLDTTIVCTVDVSGSNRYALVLIGQRTLNTVSSVTFGSDDLTELGSIYNDDDSAVHIWRLKQPTVNTGVTVTITFSGSMVESATAWVGSFEDVDQTTPLGSYVSAIEDGVDPHNFTITGDIDDYMVGVINAEYGDPIAITSGNTATELYSHDAGSYHSFFAYKVSTAGDFEFSFDVGTGTHTAYNGVAVKGLSIVNTLDVTTLDKDGEPLNNVECFLFEDNLDKTLTFKESVLSNQSGIASFSVSDTNPNYTVVARRDDDPHIMDVTDFTLQPSEP